MYHSIKDFFASDEIESLIAEWKSYQNGPGSDGFTYTGSLLEFIGCTKKQYDEWFYCATPIPRNEQ